MDVSGRRVYLLSEERGLSGRNVSSAAAVALTVHCRELRGATQLRREGVVQRRKEGRTNAWRLTARGQDAVRSLQDLRCDVPGLTGRAWSVAGREET